MAPKRKKPSKRGGPGDASRFGENPQGVRKRQKPAELVAHKNVDLTRAAQAQQALFYGMMLYIQNPGLTLKKVWGTGRIDPDDETSPMICDMISWDSFNRAAAKGKWTRKRDEHWAEIEKRVLAESQSQMVTKMTDELTTIEAVGRVLMQNIAGDTAAGIKAARPKSLEGAVQAFLKLDKWRQEKRDKVFAIQAAAAGQEADEGQVIDVTPEAPAVEDNLTADEVAQMAEYLAAQRAGIDVKLITDSRYQVVDDAEELYDEDGEE